MQLFERIRFPLLAVAIFAALAAMWAGLVRMGWQFPPLSPALTVNHGPLMISGFLGIVISIERVVALGQRWTYASPIFSALGVLALVIGLPESIGQVLLTLGSAGLVAIFIVIVRRHTALFTVTMLLGTLAWLIGNALWLSGAPIYRVVFWWGAFLVLTIVGERLELGRLLQLPKQVRWLFVGAVAILIAGLVLTLALGDLGNRLFGVGMLALAVWLLRFDIARRTIQQTGLTRFIAACMLSGYVWLGVSGILSMAFGQVTGGFQYDAVLHTLFLGFVFAMIFGHAPIILPSVVRVPVDYQPAFYLHLALLHLSLALRIIGDLTTTMELRQWGGMFNVIAILVFMFNTARVLRASANKKSAKG